jgi:hypothetical protein
MRTEKRNAPLLAGNDAPNSNDKKSKHKTNSNGELISMKTNSNGELISMNNFTPARNNFQYLCSFCWRDLPDNGTRFAGFGACPTHYALAFKFVDSLREHRARYFNSNFGGAK